MDIGASEHFQDVAGYMEWVPRKRGWCSICSITVKVIKADKGRKKEGDKSTMIEDGKREES